MLMDGEKKHEEKAVSQQETVREETARTKQKVKFEFYGKAIVEKKVKRSGNTGRVYLPPDWVGKSVKVIRIN
jgi:putative transposon-encoded protein